MLEAEIVKQGQLFAEAVLLGALLLLLYDALRILRRVRRHGIVAVAAEDLLFWLFCALGMFGFMYRQNDGVIRGFLIFGAAIGMILYGVLASRYVVRTGTACLRRILYALGRAVRICRAPFQSLGRYLRIKLHQRYHHFVKRVTRETKTADRIRANERKRLHRVSGMREKGKTGFLCVKKRVK